MSAALSALLCFTGCNVATPTTITLTHSPAFMQTEMSLVPSMVCRQAASLPYDPVLCLEASGHRTDPAGQSGPGPQIPESCASRDAFGRGAAFGGTAPHPVVRKAGSTSH